MSEKASPVRQPAPPESQALREDQVPREGQAPRDGQAPPLLEVAGLIVQALNLDIAAAEIEPDAPLYGAGLGLDSIDILEIALVVSKQYGVQLRSDSEDNQRIFRSLRHLVAYITAHRTK